MEGGHIPIDERMLRDIVIHITNGFRMLAATDPKRYGIFAKEFPPTAAGVVRIATEQDTKLRDENPDSVINVYSTLAMATVELMRMDGLGIGNPETRHVVQVLLALWSGIRTDMMERVAGPCMAYLEQRARELEQDHDARN